MVGHALFAFKDVFGILLSVVGVYLGWNHLDINYFRFLFAVSPSGVLDDLNRFFTQLTALAGVIGCFLTAATLVWQNFSRARKQVRADIIEIREETRKDAEQKDRKIAELTDAWAAAHSLAESSQQEIERVKAVAARRVADLESEVAKLHTSVAKNSANVSTLKMESDERKARAPDPARPLPVVVMNTESQPVPIAPAPDGGPPRA